MTKLEKKLEEMGYKETPYGNWLKYHDDNGYFIFEIEILKKIKGMVRPNMYTWFRTQQDIDNLQQAFNEMQKDLEILKECEK